MGRDILTSALIVCFLSNHTLLHSIIVTFPWLSTTITIYYRQPPNKTYNQIHQHIEVRDNLRTNRSNLRTRCDLIKPVNKTCDQIKPVIELNLQTRSTIESNLQDLRLNQTWVLRRKMGWVLQLGLENLYNLKKLVNWYYYKTEVF